MKLVRKYSLGLLLSALAMDSAHQNLRLSLSTNARAQDLKDELDALDDLPEADLSEVSGSSPGASAPAASPADAAAPSAPSTASSSPATPAGDDVGNELGDDLGNELADSSSAPPTQDAPQSPTPAATPAPAATASANAETGADADLGPDLGDELETAQSDKPAKNGEPTLDAESLDDLETKTADSGGASDPSLEADLDKELDAQDPGAAVAQEPKASSPESTTETADLDKEIGDLADETAPAEAVASQALTGVDAEPAGRLTSLDFKQLPDRVRLVLKSDKALDFAKEVRGQRRQVIVELRNVAIGKSLLKRALDTGEFDGPVALVQAYDSKSGALPSVKVLFQLRKNQTPVVTRNGAEIYVDFPIANDGKFVAQLNAQGAPAAPAIPKTFLSIDENTRFVGTRINLNVKDAELPDVLNFLSRTSGKNFVLAGSTSAKVTLNVTNTPWDQVLALVLFNNRLGYQQMGNLYRIVPVTDLKSELDEASKVAGQAEDLIATQTQILPVSYAKAADIMTNVKDFQTKRGKASVDARTNSLVVTDIPSVLDKVRQYIRSVDKQTAQVLIEGRIVDAKQDFSRALNVQWKLGEFSSGKFAGSFANVGGSGSALDSSPPTYSQLAKTGDAGGLRMRLGELSSLGAIQAILGLAETQNKAKVIASPRVTVLDNKQATITQGKQFTFQVAGTGTADGGLQTVQANLSLDVTPQVTSDGFVMMKINLKRDTPIAANRGDLDTRSAATEMLVESGKTAVIGGIYTLDRTDTESGWPFLKNLPILGGLFRNVKSISDSSNELLMFISPTILNPDKTFVAYGNSPMDEEKSISTRGGAEKISSDLRADLDSDLNADLDADGTVPATMSAASSGGGSKGSSGAAAAGSGSDSGSGTGTGTGAGAGDELNELDSLPDEVL